MKIAVIGGTGRTGRHLVERLLERGHSVTALVRDAARMPIQHDRLTLIVGDSRVPADVARLVDGTDAVVSALGPDSKDATLHRDTAALVIDQMQRAGVRRFVGVSGAGIDVPGDDKSLKDRLISAVIRTVGGGMAQDKASEYSAFAATDLEWTLVRPPRLVDGEPTGRLEHDAHRSTTSSRIVRADLAVFLADVLDEGRYVGQAPFVASAR